MKNFFVIGLLITSIFGFGQSKDKVSIFNRKNEIKIGAIHLLGGPILEGSYEYIYSKDFTFGTSVLLSLDNTDYYAEELSVTHLQDFISKKPKNMGRKDFLLKDLPNIIQENTINTCYLATIQKNSLLPL